MLLQDIYYFLFTKNLQAIPILNPIFFYTKLAYVFDALYT
jgi:hypothetical protein